MEFIYYLKYYYYYFDSVFTGYPVIIKLTIFLVFLLLVLYIVSIIRVLVINAKIRRHDKAYARMEVGLKRELTDVLYSDDNYSEEMLKDIFSDKLHLVKKKYEKKKFTELLVEIIDTNDGNKCLNNDNYLSVLEIFNILEFWSKKMTSNSAKRRHHALRALDDLNLGLSGSAILRSVYHKNKNLRKHARATLLKYDNNHPYKFLEESFDQDFNTLDEVRLHYFLSEKYKDNQLPLLIRWVKSSKNNSFKAFLIREIGVFGQEESVDVLMDMLNLEEDSKVLCSIIETLGRLKYIESESKLIEEFQFSNRSIQSSIIDTLAEFKTLSSLDFLEHVFFSSHDTELKIQLAYAMQKFGQVGTDRLSLMSKKSSGFDKDIFAQVRFKLI